MQVFLAPRPISADNEGMASRQLMIRAIEKAKADKMLKDKAREVACALKDALPAGYGFLLVITDDGEGSESFVSDFSRERAIQVARSVLAQLEGS